MFLPLPRSLTFSVVIFAPPSPAGLFYVDGYWAIETKPTGIDYSTSVQNWAGVTIRVRPM